MIPSNVPPVQASRVSQPHSSGCAWNMYQMSAPKATLLLSGGTDGEDGPTDAAGAILDAEILATARQYQLDPADYLARNDAYNFFRPLDALIKTGPTHTNVCDIRVVVVDRAD